MIRPILCALLLAACAATAVYRSPGPYVGGALLPPGTYLQDVSIQPKKGGAFRFEGVLERRLSGATVISGLSPFGTTMFRITDAGGKAEPKVEIFLDELKAHGDRVLSFYEGLRPLLRLRDDPAASPREVKSRHPDQRPERVSASSDVSLTVEGYDSAGRAAKLFLQAPFFDAHVSLREYHAP